jgi:uncharacterized protein YbjT (DUF2867 family)
VRGDLSVPAVFDQNLDGVQAAYLVWRLATIDTAPAVVDHLSKRARRVVFQSSALVRDEATDKNNPLAKQHLDIERLIERSGVEWTFLLPGSFATNSLMWWAPQIRSGNIVRWPFAAVQLAPIHEAGIAAVAMHALIGVGHHGKEYRLTGPSARISATEYPSRRSHVM